MEDVGKTKEPINGLVPCEHATERKNMEEELWKHREHLEEMVKERTNRLITTNTCLQREFTECRRLQEELDYFFTLSLDILCIADFNCCFKRVNPAFEKTLGFTEEELLAKSFLSFIHPEDKAASIEEVQKLTGGKPTIYFKNRYICKDGSFKWLEWTGMPDTEKNLIVFVARDITKHKLLREELNRIIKVVESSGDAIGMANAAGRSIYHNKAFIQKFEYTVEELNTANGLHVLYSNPEVYREVFDTIFKGDSWNGEIEILTRSGRTIPVLLSANSLRDDNGKIIGLLGIYTDITKNKQAEDALRFSEERFSKAFNANPNMMVITTLADGRYIDVNDSFTDIMGYCRKEVIGRTTTELNNWLKPKDRLQIVQILNEQGTVRNLEIEFCTKSGNQRVGLFSAELIDLYGVKCVLLSVNDITESKQLKKDMARLERLHLIGEMAAGIGHEIRNPMTTVRGFLQLLRGKKECEKFAQFFNLMIEELDRANLIITEYLSLAKNKTVNLKLMNLNSIVKALTPLMQADAISSDKYVNVELRTVPDLFLDEKEIRQLVLNLVRNGLEAMQPGGNVTVKTFVDAKKVVLSVQDQGKGIEPHLIEKIGTPFFTTKDNGTGLGLATCYSIAARHNAIIKVETGPKGTTFFVKFRLQ